MARTTIATLLGEGRTALGARTVTASPTMVEVYGHMGFDFVWLDLEHCGGSPYDADLLEGYTRAADAVDVDLLVRLPTGEPSLVRKVLDTGVRSLLIPQVETVDDLRPAIEAARYTYDGRPGTRGSGIGRENVWTAAIPEDTGEVDEQIAVGCMVETETAVRNLDELLSVPELGFAFVGPSDLSISYGHPFERSHPEVTAAIETVEAACLDADVPLGGVTDDTAAARSKLEAGYRLLRVGDEVSSARTVLGERLDGLR
ncbi:MAG TPA: aldolase/citrate lyase family protein [Halobacteriales archaeon]|nr:aldolase/citrate lyase family protein [Halobacteriales archaeon]